MYDSDCPVCDLALTLEKAGSAACPSAVVQVWRLAKDACHFIHIGGTDLRCSHLERIIIECHN